MNIKNLLSSNLLEPILLLLFVTAISILVITLFKKFERNLLKEVKDAIEPKFIETSTDTESLLNLAIEIWRLNQKLSKISGKLNESERRGINFSIQKLTDFTGKYDLDIRDYTGQKYNSGLTALEVISVEKNKKSKEDVVKETVEPAIYLRGKLIKKAKVILNSK